MPEKYKNPDWLAVDIMALLKAVGKWNFDAVVQGIRVICAGKQQDTEQLALHDLLCLCLQTGTVDVTYLIKSILLQCYMEGEDLVIKGSEYDLEMRCVAMTDGSIDIASPASPDSFWGIYKRPANGGLADWIADYAEPLEALRCLRSMHTKLNVFTN